MEEEKRCRIYKNAQKCFFYLENEVTLNTNNRIKYNNKFIKYYICI